LVEAVGSVGSLKTSGGRIFSEEDPPALGDQEESEGEEKEDSEPGKKKRPEQEDKEGSERSGPEDESKPKKASKEDPSLEFEGSSEEGTHEGGDSTDIGDDEISCDASYNPRGSSSSRETERYWTGARASIVGTDQTKILRDLVDEVTLIKDADVKDLVGKTIDERFAYVKKHGNRVPDPKVVYVGLEGDNLHNLFLAGQGPMGDQRPVDVVIREAPWGPACWAAMQPDYAKALSKFVGEKEIYFVLCGVGSGVFWATVSQTVLPCSKVIEL
jgi:hypothetical protein